MIKLYKIIIKKISFSIIFIIQIHYAQLNFLRLAPNTNWLMMVREPIQSCESWVRIINDKKSNIANKIFQMLFEVDQAIFQNDNSIGVRLEDLKEHPKKTIQLFVVGLALKKMIVFTK